METGCNPTLIHRKALHPLNQRPERRGGSRPIESWMRHRSSKRPKIRLGFGDGRYRTEVARDTKISIMSKNKLTTDVNAASSGFFSSVYILQV